MPNGIGYDKIGTSVWGSPDTAGITPEPAFGYCQKITDQKDLQIDDDGHLMRDLTIESRAKFRLLCHRGEWPYDPECGSRLHTLTTIRDAQRNALLYAQQALKPLINEGAIKQVTLGDIKIDGTYGLLAIEFLIDIPESGIMSIGGMNYL